jgi:ABC-type multidrug transport system fused ATPase/permease subunit
MSTDTTQSSPRRSSVVRSLRLVFEFWSTERKRFAWMVAMTLVSAAATVAYPRILGYLVDGIQRGLQDPASFRSNQLLDYIALLLSTGSVSSVLGNLQPIIAFNTGSLMNWRGRTNIFGRVLYMGHSFINTYPTGDVIERLDQDLGDVSWFAGFGVFWPMNSIITLLFAAVMMLRMNWLLTLVTLVPASGLAIVVRRLRPKMKKSWRDLRERISETNNFLEASYSGIRLVKAYTMEERNGSRFQRILRERIRQALIVARLSALFSSLFGSMSEVGILLILSVGGVLVIRHNLTLGDFVAFYAYVGMLVGPMMSIGDMVVRVQQTAVEDERVRGLREFKPDVDVTSGARPAPEQAEVKLVNVGFSYQRSGQVAERPSEKSSDLVTKGPSDQVTLDHLTTGPLDHHSPAHSTTGSLDHSATVLKDINMTIAPGARIGIAGTIGSGKSTLMRLLLRIAEPSEGQITIGGVSLREFDIKSLHRLFGYAPQEANLVSDTILNNITLGRETGDGRPGTTDDLVSEVSGIAQLEPDLKDMPKGLQETIGERGMKLSGGQQGRVSIARALFNKPRILLLDDVTASLDAETEQQFIRDVLEYMQGETLVIVSHRLSILAACDRIYVFDQGRIVETGTHSELLDKHGTYWKLYERQLAREQLEGE